MLVTERITEEGAWRRVKDAYTMWKAMADCIRRSAKEVLGTSRRGGNKMEGAWWWNEEIKEKVREKKEAYADFMNNGADGERYIGRTRYKAAKKVAKKAVVVANSMAYEKLYHRLGTKEGENEVFKLARVRERRARDLSVVRCIKDENGKVLFEDAEIKERWQGYFSSLLNGEGREDSTGRDPECGERRIATREGGHISKDEIKEALRRMPNGKAKGPDQIPVEV